METFTNKKIEVFISGAWVDLTPDVRVNPPVRVAGIGIKGNSLVDRMGERGTLSFSLDNSASNSAATLGYYTPGGNNVMTGWGPGLPVHLYLEYNNIRKYFFFYIDNDGITATPGLYGERDVKVKASNWMQKAAEYKLDLIGYQINQTFDTATRYILDRMPRQPQNTEFSTGQNTFATVFDITRVNTKALGEINKLVMSEWGTCWIRPDGQNGETLVLRDSEYRNRWLSSTVEDDNGKILPVKESVVTSYLLLTSGDKLLKTDNSSFIKIQETQYAAFTDADIESMRWEYGKNMYNHIVFKTYPRRIDAAATTVLWSMPTGETITLTAGEQITDIRGAYRDPNGGFAKVNGIEMVTPVSGTDYAAYQNADGTGTNYTSSLGIIAEYGAAEVKYTLTNNAAATIYVTVLQARGKGVYIYDTNDKLYTTGTGGNYGEVPLEIDMPYLNNINDLVYLGTGSTIWTGFLNGVAFPIPSISNVTMTVNKSSKQMLAFMCVNPGDTMKISDSVTATNTFGNYANPFYVQGYDFEIINGSTVVWHMTMKIQGVA